MTYSDEGSLHSVFYDYPKHNFYFLKTRERATETDFRFGISIDENFFLILFLTTYTKIKIYPIFEKKILMSIAITVSKRDIE